MMKKVLWMGLIYGIVLLFLIGSVSALDNVSLTLLSPSYSPVNVSSDVWFNVSVNATCVSGSCVLTNLSLTSLFGLDSVYADSSSKGANPSIGVDSDGFVHMSFQEETNDYLRYCENTGGSFSCSNIDTTSLSGHYSSLAIDSNDKVHIAHTTIISGNLRYCENTGGSFSCSQIDTGTVGKTDIAIDSGDNVHIVWSGAVTRYCNNTGGGWSCVQVLSSTSSQNPSIAIDSSDNVHMMIVRNDNTYYYNMTVGSGFGLGVFDAGVTIKYPSMLVDSNDDLWVSYQDSVDEILKVGFYNGSWNYIELEDFVNDVSGGFTSIAEDMNGNIYISYYVETPTFQRYLGLCDNSGGSWYCRNIARADSSKLGLYRPRSMVIKKGRIVDSTSFSDSIHIIWQNNSRPVYSEYKLSGLGDLVFTSYDTPFFTNISNPLDVSLNLGESLIGLWWINASGVVNDTATLNVVSEVNGSLVDSTESFVLDIIELPTTTTTTSTTTTTTTTTSTTTTTTTTSTTTTLAGAMGSYGGTKGIIGKVIDGTYLFINGFVENASIISNIVMFGVLIVVLAGVLTLFSESGRNFIDHLFKGWF